MQKEKDRSRPSEALKESDDPIAVVGVSCRFPGAPSVESYWNVLRNGVDATSEVPSGRWPIDDFYDADPVAPGKVYTRRGGFIENVYDFDAGFFGIAPKEAISIDPQQRLLLEVTWEALENAAVAPDRLEGTQTGVFIGISTNDFLQIGCRRGSIDTIDPYSGTGAAASVAAGRISYILGLQGPNYPVDTACSSSLVAAHLACKSLRRGECDTAVVAGVNLLLTPEPMVYFCKLKALSPDGRCKTFDAMADGYGRSEGCGALVLKRLSEAQSSGLPVLALIRGSAVNHDGRSSGLTVPNVAAQESVIRQAMLDADVGPEDIQYVEAHGTGTPLGDPIELQAIGAVHREVRGAKNPLLVGSAKTNIGHLEAAAGVAGLIKVVLALQHRNIPPHLHFRQPNPYVPWDELPIEVPTELREWPDTQGPRLSGLSSFGFSGTNAHLIVGEAPDVPARKQEHERPTHILCLSAKSEEVLGHFASTAAQAFTELEDTEVPDVCYTANTGRGQFTHRLTVTGSTRDEMQAALSAYAEQRAAPNLSSGVAKSAQSPKIVFLFSGHGAQYVNMGRELYETEPTFRRAMEEVEELTRPQLKAPLLSVMYPKDADASGPQDFTYLQSAMFAFQYAMAQLWKSFGVEPAAVMGHSVGEYTAACVADVLSVEDVARLNDLSRPIEQSSQEGAMLTVFAEEGRVAKVVAAYAGEVEIAAVNGPRNVVVSGAAEQVRLVAGELAEKGVRTHPLDVPLAFHSPLVEPVLGSVREVASELAYRQPKIGFVSTVTGGFVNNGEVSQPEYWVRHLRQPVRFADCIQLLDNRGYDVFIEVSPQPTLLSMARQNVADRGQLWLPSMRPSREPWGQLVSVLRQLYLRGVNIDWRGFDRHHHRRYVSFPNYPFNRQDFSNPNLAYKQLERDERRVPQALGGHHLLGTAVRSPAIRDIIYDRVFTVTSPPYLSDHKVFGMVIAPGASHLSMVLAALKDSGSAAPYALHDSTFPEPLLLTDDEGRVVQTILTPEPDDESAMEFRVMSTPHGEALPWVMNASGKVKLIEEEHSNGSMPSQPPAPAEFQARSAGHRDDSEDFYRLMAERGLQYGPTFQWIDELWWVPREGLARVCMPEKLEKADAYVLHPGLIDAAFQLMAVALVDEALERGVYVPVKVDEFKFYGQPNGGLWIYVHVPKDLARDRLNFIADISVFDDAGTVVADIKGARVRWASRELLSQFTQRRMRDWFYTRRWMPIDVEEPVVAAEDDEHEIVETEIPTSGRWLVFADDGGVATRLAEHLRERDEACLLVSPGSGLETQDDTKWTVDPADPEHFAQLCETAVAVDERELKGVVFLWSLDHDDGSTQSNDRFVASQDRGARAVLHLIQGLNKIRRDAAPAVLIASAGAQSIDDDAAPLRYAHAPLWGLGRVFALEHPNLRCSLVDVDPSAPAEEQAESLINELTNASREDQVGYRNGQRYGARLTRFANEGADARNTPFPIETEPYRLVKSEQGVLKDLRLTSIPRVAPGHGEVEILVHASSLNFRDVLNALNLYPGEAGPLGLECTGIVTAVGEDADFNIGDRVVALAPGCFSKYVTVDARLAALLPENQTWEEGATLPITFLTATSALIDLAKIRADDKVLIHAGAGGVGMAAIQIARHAGAEIYATAGNPEKRELLNSLGVHHVFDSRSLDFADEILKITDGDGVNIVLNSLTGDYIPKSLSVLADGGRFVEIGKIGIWESSRVAEHRPDVDYHIFALDEELLEDPAKVGQKLRDILPKFSEDGLAPLPNTCFSVTEASSAFQFMAQAKHKGKVVITHPATEARGTSAGEIRADATYLVTGGLGGLGLNVARWLVEQGARNLVLLGRNVPSDDARQTITDLEHAGADVVVKAADVSDFEALGRVFAEIGETLPPLRGIFHAAGVLDNDTLAHLDWERFNSVTAPKTIGALNLHALTKNCELDYFVLFSSIAAVLGSPGQGNYAAGNAFLDAFAQYRRAQGLAATSINWGPWSEIGMAANAESEVRRQWTAMGIGSISPTMGIAAMEFLLTSTAPNVAVLPIDWAKLLRLFPADRKPPLLDEIAAGINVSLEPSKEWLEFVDKINAAPPAERKEIMIAHLQEMATTVLELDPENPIDPRAPLHELGFDSLMAVNLVNQLGAAAGTSLSATLLFDHPTLESLAGYLLDNVVDAQARAKSNKRRKTPDAKPDVVHTAITQPPTTAKPSETTESLLDSITSMTDEEVESLLDTSVTREEHDSV